MNKVLVVGANSSLAQEAIKRLRTENTVITAGRKGCDLTLDLAEDVTIPDGLDVVINFAAAFSDEGDSEVMSMVQTNVVGALRLAIAAKHAGARHLIQISSMSAVHSPKSPYYSMYAITKRQADEALDWYCNKQILPLTILRPSQLYGVNRGLAKHQPFFYRIVDAAIHGEDVTIYGKHDALRNYIDVRDFSEILARTVTQPVVGVYPCLYPQNVAYSEIAETAQKVFAQGGRIVFLEDKPDTPDNIFPIDTSLYEQLDYWPQITLEACLRDIKLNQEGIHE